MEVGLKFTTCRNMQRNKWKFRPAPSRLVRLQCHLQLQLEELSSHTHTHTHTETHTHTTRNEFIAHAPRGHATAVNACGLPCNARRTRNLCCCLPLQGVQKERARRGVTEGGGRRGYLCKINCANFYINFLDKAGQEGVVWASNVP